MIVNENVLSIDKKRINKNIWFNVILINLFNDTFNDYLQTPNRPVTSRESSVESEQGKLIQKDN